MADISKIKLPDNTEYEIKDAKARMVILKYGISTWQDFLTAYQNKCVVYCRASSNSNPATGSQTRMAFMAYVSNEDNPTNVEFQYYRSMNKHTDAQQGDQVFVYKLTNANKWTVTTRNAFSKVIAGDNLTSSFVESETNSSITLAANYDSTVTQNSTKLITSGAVYDAISAIPSGASTLSDLTDVTLTTPTTDQVLSYDGAKWVNANSPSGSSTLANLTDVAISTPINNQTLEFDAVSGKWQNVTPSPASGISSDVKSALLGCFANVTWSDAYGQEHYDVLAAALNGKTVILMTATFTQGSIVIYAGLPLDTLRPYLVVELDYDDSTSYTISGYTLSGTLSEGVSTITATYNGYTATFTVQVTATEIDPVFGSRIHYIDFTYRDGNSHFVDEHNTSTYAIASSGCVYTEGIGVQGFATSSAYITLPAFTGLQVNDTYVLDFGEISWTQGSSHGRLLMYTGDSGLIYRSGSDWNYYGGSSWGNNITTSSNYLSNSKFGVKIIANNQLLLHKDGTSFGTVTNNMAYKLIDGTVLTIGSTSGQGYGTATLKSLKVFRAAT